MTYERSHNEIHGKNQEITTDILTLNLLLKIIASFLRDEFCPTLLPKNRSKYRLCNAKGLRQFLNKEPPI